jgi:hypothetical protein
MWETMRETNRDASREICMKERLRLRYGYGEEGESGERIQMVTDIEKGVNNRKQGDGERHEEYTWKGGQERGPGA